MTLPPKDFRDLLPPHQASHHDGGPVYYLWVFDPHEDKVILEHNQGRHRAEHVDHAELARRVPHPERIHGYAYKILGGWRITDWEHRPIDDPHVVKKVRERLKGETIHPAVGSQVQSRTK